jgi:multicomponent Na+:H+ antiporter subunit E
MSWNLGAWLDLAVFFARELWGSNLRVAFDILRPRPRVNPAIIAVPLELQKNWSVTLMANLITLTPGTLSLDLSEDGRVLYVHTMYFDNDDRAAFVASIKQGFEKRLLRLEGTKP